MIDFREFYVCRDCGLNPTITIQGYYQVFHMKCKCGGRYYADFKGILKPKEKTQGS